MLVVLTQDFLQRMKDLMVEMVVMFLLIMLEVEAVVPVRQDNPINQTRLVMVEMDYQHLSVVLMYLTLAAVVVETLDHFKPEELEELVVVDLEDTNPELVQEPTAQTNLAEVVELQAVRLYLVEMVAQVSSSLLTQRHKLWYNT
jgi:hypothetical protein